MLILPIGQTATTACCIPHCKTAPEVKKVILGLAVMIVNASAMEMWGLVPLCGTGGLHSFCDDGCSTDADFEADVQTAVRTASLP
jgi:hypothetical protein